MKIVFDESTLKQGDNTSRSITGVIYFDFNGFLFPWERWNDFVVVITTWWLDGVKKLERGIEREVTLRFMDGPYWIVLKRKDEDTILRCIEDRCNAGVIHEQYIDLLEFAKQIRQLSRQVASACYRRGFESRDIDTLKSYLNLTN